MSETTMRVRAAQQPDGLGAFITDMYAVTNEINLAVLERRGETPPTAPPPTGIGSVYEFFGGTPSNQPTWNMITTAAAHVLLHHILPAQEGPLAAMGERAREQQALLLGLGEEKLTKHLHWQLGGLLMKMSTRKLYGPNKSGLDEILTLDEYRRTGEPDSVMVFGGIRSLLTKERRQVRHALKHIIFGGKDE